MTVRQILQRNPALRAALAVPLAVRRELNRQWNRPMTDFFGRFEQLVVSDVEVQVDEFDGTFAIGPKSHLLRRLLVHGRYEPELAELFAGLIQPDRDVVDVGANIGFFTVLAARRLGKGRVLAAEPTSAAHARLCRNLAANGVADKAIVFNGLVGATDSSTEIKIVAGREEYSSTGAMVHPSIKGEAVTVETLPIRPLDALVRDHGLAPALVKIDVEGAEMAVFEGAQETLKTHRPVVISEFARPLLERNGTSPEAVIALLDRCGYDVNDPFDPKLKPGDSPFGDIIATPR